MNHDVNECQQIKKKFNSIPLKSIITKIESTNKYSKTSLNDGNRKGGNIQQYHLPALVFILYYVL